MPRGSASITEAVLYEGPDASGPVLDIVRFSTVQTMVAGDTLHADTAHGRFRALVDVNQMPALDHFGRVLMVRDVPIEVRPLNLPDLSDPAAVERWLASDEAGEP